MSTVAEREAIRLAKKRFKESKLIITIADGREIPPNKLGEKAIGLHIVETLPDGRLVVVPEYPSNHWY